MVLRRAAALRHELFAGFRLIGHYAFARCRLPAAITIQHYAIVIRLAAAGRSCQLPAFAISPLRFAAASAPL